MTRTANTAAALLTPCDADPLVAMIHYAGWTAHTLAAMGCTYVGPVMSQHREVVLAAYNNGLAADQAADAVREAHYDATDANLPWTHPF